MAELGAFKRRPIRVAHYRGNSHTHTSAKKDVISTKPRKKAMGAVRTFPREAKKRKAQPTLPPWKIPPAKCRRPRGMLPGVSRAARGGGGGQSL